MVEDDDNDSDGVALTLDLDVRRFRGRMEARGRISSAFSA